MTDCVLSSGCLQHLHGYLSLADASTDMYASIDMLAHVPQATLLSCPDIISLISNPQWNNLSTRIVTQEDAASKSCRGVRCFISGCGTRPFSPLQHFVREQMLCFKMLIEGRSEFFGRIEQPAKAQASRFFTLALRTQRAECGQNFTCLQTFAKC